MANLVVITGRLTKDIECKYTQQGMAVGRFTLALDRGKDKNGQDKGADFPSVVAFGKTAENLEKFSGKGLRVSVIGHLQTGSYEKDGQKVYTTDVIADRVDFIDWKQAGQQTAAPAEPAPAGFDWSDDSIPF
jgi:single-strand DNA-binding protein